MTGNLKPKQRRLGVVITILCQSFVLFGSDLGLPVFAKEIAFGFTILGYVFFIFPAIWKSMGK